jgi:DNA-binding response OmpR family regulator
MASAMAPARVLVVDDEPKIRELVGGYLVREGYSVLFAENGEAALDAALREHPDLVVLDLKLPDLPGEEVARAVRGLSDLPIIMLTAKSAEADRLAGLALGADDYLVKPFSVRELAARVAAVLRRTRGMREQLSFDGGRLVVDPSARTAVVEGAAVPLTRTETEVLLALVANAPRALSREQLLTAAGGYEAEAEERTVDAHVKNLRRKLGDDPRAPRYVLTVAGVGYRFGLPRDD